MDMLKQLNTAVAYIEANLSGKTDFDKVSELTCVTKDTFLRFFSYMAGMTLNEYIRRRRLTLAVKDLRSGSRVIDVAVKYGWDSADAFTKAFIRQHGITPTQARDVHTPLKIYPPVSFYIMIKGAKEMNFKIIETGERKVFGISRAIGGKSSERFKTEHIMWADDCGGYDGLWYGIWKNGNYTIARDSDHVTGAELEMHVIPSGTYAVFTTPRGGYAGDELPKLHDLIHDSWLPDSEYRQTDDFELEVYHLWTARAERQEKRYYEIWIPVGKKRL